jgi:hypothetical protein
MAFICEACATKSGLPFIAISGLLLACFLFQGCTERKNSYLIYRGVNDSACIQGHIFYDISRTSERGWIPKFDGYDKPCECDTNAKR